MSGQSRILRREYTGNLSLKTTDHCRTTSLLPRFSPSSTRVSPHGGKLDDGLFLCELENILSPLECAEVIKNGDKCIFENMSDKYSFGKQRNSSRLLVLDEALGNNLWENIKSVLSKEMDQLEISRRPLGFDVTRGEWELHGLNEAMRISKYSGKKKEFFRVHKDAQYCPNGDQRSLFTLLVYLNDIFRGGETCFYFPKDINQNTKGMTTQEEIDALGGLNEGFDCVKIVPNVGHAVLFSQNMLHESLPIRKGTKYILKTDVVVKRHSKQFGFAVESKEKEDYLKCLNYFREAQQQELKGNFQAASDLYERALSIRYCYPRSLQTAASEPVVNKDDEQNNCVFFPLAVWLHIFSFLSGYDAQNVVYAYPQLRLARQSLEKHKQNVASRLHVSGQKHLPKVNYQRGIITSFEFPDTDFFRDHANGCCRVAAMYSFFLLGHKAEDDVYTVRYNPDTQDVCAVALKTLLTDVFYNRRCYGSFYNVRQQDPKMREPKKDFEASVDRNYMLLRHGAEFVGVELPDSFYVKSTAYPVSDDDSEEEDEVDEEMEDESEEKGEDESLMGKDVEPEVQEEKREQDEKEGEDEGPGEEDGGVQKEVKVVSEECIAPKKQKEICDGSVPFYGEIGRPFNVDSLLRMFIYMQCWMYLTNTDAQLCLVKMFDMLDQYGDVVFLKALENILSVMKNAPSVSCTLVSKLKKPLSIAANDVCICYHGPNDEMLTYMGDSCTTEFYNHVVFDFQQAQLSVKCDGNEAMEEECTCGDEILHPDHFESISKDQEAIGCTGEEIFYHVNIEPILSPGTSFNHASCQCGNPRFEVHDYINMKDYPYLNHVHLVAREHNGKMLVWSVYGGIVAL